MRRQLDLLAVQRPHGSRHGLCGGEGDDPGGNGGHALHRPDLTSPRYGSLTSALPLREVGCSRTVLQASRTPCGQRDLQIMGSSIAGNEPWAQPTIRTPYRGLCDGQLCDIAWWARRPRSTTSLPTGSPTGRSWSTRLLGAWHGQFHEASTAPAVPPRYGETVERPHGQ